MMLIKISKAVPMKMNAVKTILSLGAIGFSAISAWSLPNLAIRDVSGKTQKNVAITFGQGFPKGTKFTSLNLTAGTTLYPTQVDVKRKYEDGSIKHAIISGILPELAANQVLNLELKSNMSPAPTTAVSISSADVPDIVVRFSILAGNGIPSAVKQVSLRDLALASPSPKYWLRGSVMAEALYEGPPKTLTGSSPDTYLNVQFHVRYYPDTKLSRVSIIADNTSKMVRTNIKYSLTILNAGKTLFNRDTLTHFYSSRWKKTYNLGIDGFTEPEIINDIPYLVQTGLLPRYAAGITVSATSLSDSWDRYIKSNHDIMGNGPITPYFPQTGGREDIGLYPGWTTRYLFSMDTRARTIFYAAGDLSGSFSIHLRDSKEKRIISIEEHPTASLLDAAARYSAAADRIPDPVGDFSSPYTVDCPHQASFVYVPYLLSGDLYYLEELYHWADYNVLSKNQEYRGNGLGLLYGDQSRGQAWALRTIADAAAIAPDDHPEKGYFDKIVTNNLTYYDTAMVNFSSLGMWGVNSNLAVDGGRPDASMDANVRFYTSPWMSDFLTVVMDHLVDLGFSKAKPIRNHLIKNAIGRVTSGPGFNPFDASPYHLAESDVSGKKYSTWTEVWKASFANRKEAIPNAYSDVGDCSHGYTYILRAVLTAAKRDSLPNGKEAYEFVDSHLPKTCFADVQTWAIVPNAGDKVLPKGGAGILDFQKKKILDPLVSVRHHNGTTSLHVNSMVSPEKIHWRLMDSKGSVLQSFSGQAYDISLLPGRQNIHIYEVSTPNGKAAGLVPLIF